jgi:hypothetical protein
VKGTSRTCFLIALFLITIVITSPAQQFYATSETTGQLDRIDLPSQTVTSVYTTAGSPDSLLINSQGQLIYDLSSDGILAIYDPATQTNTILTNSLKGKSPRDMVFDVPTACNPNANANTMLLSEYSIGQIVRYDFTTGTITKLGAQLGSPGNGFSVDGLAYDAQGELFAIADHNTVVQLDPCTGDVLKTLVLEPHDKVNGGDGMVFDPYSGQLWISHDGTDRANGLIEVPTDLSSFLLFQVGQISVPDGIVSDGKGNLYIGAGLQKLMVYNIPTDTLAQPQASALVVPGIDSLALIPGTATSTALSASPNPAVAGQAVTLTATITPTPTGPPLGTVIFYNGSTLLNTATVNSSGVATFTTGSLPAGSDSLTAAYSGNIDFAASTSAAVVETITGTATSTALSASPNPAVAGQAVVLTATVTPTPTGASLGNVSFYNNSNLLGTSPVNSSGIATFRISGLPLGTNSVTATYSGNVTFASSTSAALTLIVGSAATFTVAGPQSPVTVAGGNSKNITITVTAVGGDYDSAITMSASGLPADAAVSFGPPTVNPKNSSARTTMTIQTTTQDAGIPAKGKSDFPFAPICVAASLCLIGGKYRRIAGSLPMLVVFSCLAGGTLVLSGCGGGGTSSGQPQSQSKDYVVTVTGSDGSLNASTTFTLTVH